MRCPAIAGAVVAIACLASGNARAAPDSYAARTTLEKVRARGVVRCGSVERPGLARSGRGGWDGLAVEVCRAVAVAVLGEGARYVYRGYESNEDFAGVASGNDDIAFLTFGEMAAQGLAAKLLPGPTIFVESHDVLVAGASRAHALADLAGAGICFIIGTAAENSLEAWFHEHGLAFVPHAFQEEEEMYDAFNVGQCQAVVGEATALASARRDHGVNNLASRLLSDHLATFPIVLATPLAADAKWAAIAAWSVDTLLNADARETRDRPSGLRAMTVPGEALGLPADWQKAMLGRVGTYADIYRRTLGAGSPLQLGPGLNALPRDGGILLAPLRD